MGKRAAADLAQRCREGHFAQIGHFRKGALCDLRNAFRDVRPCGRSSVRAKDACLDDKILVSIVVYVDHVRPNVVFHDDMVILNGFFYEKSRSAKGTSGRIFFVVDLQCPAAICTFCIYERHGNTPFPKIFSQGKSIRLYHDFGLFAICFQQNIRAPLSLCS